MRFSRLIARDSSGIIICSPAVYPAMFGAHIMPKELKRKKEAKKKPTLTPKEKKAAKRSKKEG
jgi:hypothetical protein